MCEERRERGRKKGGVKLLVKTGLKVTKVEYCRGKVVLSVEKEKLGQYQGHDSIHCPKNKQMARTYA